MQKPDLDHRLLDLLVCPVTKGPLVWDRERQELVSKAARLAYPVRDGVPYLLESEARPLDGAPAAGAAAAPADPA